MKPVIVSELIPGATYAIEHDNWEGNAVFISTDAPDHPVGTLRFKCEDGIDGYFRIEHVKRLTQHQGSLTDQLAELHRIATSLKLYDAADWLRERMR